MALKVPVVVEKPELAVVLGAVLLLLVLLAVAPVPPRAFRMDGPAPRFGPGDEQALGW